ncbi:MAG: DapH/DapD/GlmU-related protein [Myxococcales bacterium]
MDTSSENIGTQGAPGSQTPARFDTFLPRLQISEAVFQSVPAFVANRLRTRALRFAGVRIGTGTVFFDFPTMVGSGNFVGRLSVGELCGFNRGCFFELDDQISIGNHVAVGHDVMLLTRTHELGHSSRRAGAVRTAPVVIEDGVWLGARCTVLPGVTIGAGAVIGSSVVITKNVPPDSLVMGNTQISIAKWR